VTKHLCSENIMLMLKKKTIVTFSIEW